MLSIQKRSERRKKRARNRLALVNRGRLRLSVHRSSKNLYVQLIDDASSSTVVSASTIDPEFKSQMTKGYNLEAARVVGKMIAERALKKNISSVVFDKGSFKYHGRIRALADAAREQGLQF